MDSPVAEYDDITSYLAEFVNGKQPFTLFKRSGAGEMLGESNAPP